MTNVENKRVPVVFNERVLLAEIEGVLKDVRLVRKKLIDVDYSMAVLMWKAEKRLARTAASARKLLGSCELEEWNDERVEDDNGEGC